MLHDPGGKVKMDLQPDVVGAASFSPCRKYRMVLTRKWGEGRRYILFIGMNPSTAEAEVDDPTVRRETGFARSWGFSMLVKCNTMDYRATYPRDLLNPGVVPCSDENIPIIRKMAADAEIIVACWGVPHRALLPYSESVIRALRGDCRRIHCFGLTASGFPRHPLYLSGDTQLRVFE